MAQCGLRESTQSERKLLRKFDSDMRFRVPETIRDNGKLI